MFAINTTSVYSTNNVLYSETPQNTSTIQHKYCIPSILLDHIAIDTLIKSISLKQLLMVETLI